MIERILIAVAGGIFTAVIVLIAAWMVQEALQRIDLLVPVAAGLAVAVALWTVDYLSDYLERRKPKA